MSKYIIEKVEDPNLIEFAEFILQDTPGIIAGGVFRELFDFTDDGEIKTKTMTDLKAEQSKDADIFFHNEEDFINFQNSVKSRHGSEAYQGVRSVGMGIPLAAQKMSRLIQLDLVHKYFGSPEQILDGFDFTVSQCAVYREDDELYLMYGKDFKNHLQNSILEYAEEPEKSGNIIERMMRYTSYGFTPSEDTVKKCLISFCKSFKNIQDINIDDLLLNHDFQEYYQKHLEEAERYRAKGISSKPHLRGRRKAMFNKQKQMQNEWLSFIYFLLNYWHSTVKVDSYFTASFSSKYAAAHNVSNLLEQMGSGYSYEMVDKRCGQLAGDLGIALMVEEEDEHRWVYSSHSLMKLLQLLTAEKDSLGLSKVQDFLKMMLSSRFVPQSKRSFIRCTDCSESISGEICNCAVEKEYLLELESDVILQVLQHKDDELWRNECFNFFSQIYEDRILEVPTLRQWHKFLEDELFDPTFPPDLMFALMIDSVEE